MEMKLSKAELAVLHILWSAEGPLSMDEIAKQSSYHFFRETIVRSLVEGLIDKKIVFQAGIYQGFSKEKEIAFPSYAPKISFAEFYMEQFRDISPHNLFRLTEKLLRSQKLSPQMLYDLSNIISERINSFSN